MVLEHNIDRCHCREVQCRQGRRPVGEIVVAGTAVIVHVVRIGMPNVRVVRWEAGR